MDAVVYNPKIAILDDDQEVLDELCKKLQASGFTEIESFVGGGRFLDEIDDSYDMVILDWYVPPYNALEILDKMKELNSRARIILISGRWDENIMQKLWNSGYGNTSKFVRKEVGDKYLDLVVTYVQEHVGNYLAFLRELELLRNKNYVTSESTT